MEEPIDGDPDLRNYLRVISRRRWIIIAAVVVVVGLAVGLSSLQTPVYSANAQVLVPQQPISSTLNPTSNLAPAAASAQRSLANDLVFAKGDAVLQAVQQTLGYTAHIATSAGATSDTLTFTAHNRDRLVATKIANAWATGFITASQSEQINDYSSKVGALGTTIAALRAKATTLPATDPQTIAIETSISSLTQTVQQLQAESGLVNQTGPTVVNAAISPVQPISPKPLRNGILGLAIGLLLGIGLAFIADRLDDSITSREDLDYSTGRLPLIGLVPIVDGWRNHADTHVVLIESPSSQAAEAYRSMRTAVQFLGIDQRLRVVGVTSPGAGDGKTTTTANLAVSFARAGQRVIIVSGDLRRPRIHQFFGAPNDSGLTSIILGELSVEDALHQVAGEPRLRILASGPIPPNPAEVLSLDRVRTLIDIMATTADLILIDCPPILPVTDALLISRLVDGMLIVASAGNTKKRDLERACELLRQVGAPLLGTVLNRVPPRAGYGYDYGYYTHDYGDNQASSTSAKGQPSGPSQHTQKPLASDGASPAFEEALVKFQNTDNPDLSPHTNGHATSNKPPATRRKNEPGATDNVFGTAIVQTRITEDLKAHRSQRVKRPQPTRWSWLWAKHS